MDPVLQKRVDELDVNVRVVAALRRGGIEHAHQLVRSTEEEVLRLVQGNQRALAQIVDALRAEGLRLSVRTRPS